MLKGGPGNDALDAGIGDDIVLGADGQDFMNGGANDNESFAGPGNDFIIAGQGADTVFGDGGDDWIEGGSGQDLLQGDHGAPFFDDPAQTKPGNDIFVGQVGENDYDTEGGDDLMAQNAAIDRNAGAAGFDWAFHQYDTVGGDDDLKINQQLVGLPIQLVVNRDRWQETEADSGSPFNDIIRGDDLERVVGPGGFAGCDALDPTGVARIAGLNKLVTTFPSSLADVIDASTMKQCPLIGFGGTPGDIRSGTVWAEGNILIGGGGSDLIEGRGNDDIVDGDHALSVAITVRTDPADPTSEIGRTDLMENKATSGTFGAGTTGMTLQQAVFAGLVDPGNLVAVRQIDIPAASPTPDAGLAGDCPAASADPAVQGVVAGGATPVSVVGSTIKIAGTSNCDTAAFLAEPLAGPPFVPGSQYSITLNPNGSITVADLTSVAAGPPFPKGDGIDNTLWNIENLRFCIANDAVTKACNAFQDFSVAPTAAATPSPLAFGGVKVGTTSTQAVTVSNVGLRPLSLSSVGLAIGSDPSFQIITTGTTCTATTVLATSASCIVNVRFAPTARGAVGATIAVTSNGRPLNVAVTGTGTAPIAGVSPGSLAFGKQNINTNSPTQTVTLSNTGDATLAIASVVVTGAGFNRLGGTCTTTLAAGASCTILVRFSPTTLGVRGGLVTVTDDSNSAPGSIQTVTLSGEGVVPTPVAGVSPASLAFGKQTLNTNSPTQTVTLSNTGTGALSIASVTFTTGAGFSRAGGTCGTTLAAGASCTITVRFNPSTVGVRNATLTVTDNSNNTPGSTQTVNLSGEGVVPVAGVNTTAVDFGNVQVNSSSTVDVTLSNTGGATLNHRQHRDHTGWRWVLQNCSGSGLWRVRDDVGVGCELHHPGPLLADRWWCCNQKPGDHRQLQPRHRQHTNRDALGHRHNSGQPRHQQCCRFDKRQPGERHLQCPRQRRDHPTSGQ